MIILRYIFFLSIMLFGILSLAQTPIKSDSLNQKTVSVVSENTSIEETLLRLNDNYGFDFFYVEDEIPLEKKISVNIHDVPLVSVLQKIFENTGITYFIIGKQIVLKNRSDFSENLTPNDSLKFENNLLNELKDSVSINLDSSSKKMGLIRLTKDRGLKVKKNQELTSYKKSKERLPDISPIDSADVFLGDSLKPAVLENIPLNDSNKDMHFKAKGTIALGFFLSPEFTYRNLSGSPENVIVSRDSTESGNKNLSFGVALNYYLPYSCFIRTGISYLNFKESGKYSVMDWDPNNLQYGSPGHQAPPPGYQRDTLISYSTTYNYLSIPVLIGYQVGRRLNATFVSGILFNFLLNEKSNYPPYRSPFYQQPVFPPGSYQGPAFNYYRAYLDPKTHSYKSLAISLSLNLEVGYEISRTIRLFVSPNFKYFLSSIYKSSDTLKQRPYSLGIFFGSFITLPNKASHQKKN